MEKSQIRAEMGRLDPVTAKVNTDVVSALFAFLSVRLPGTITAYLRMPSEIDLVPLVDRLPGWRWLLPRVEPDRSLTFRHYEGPRERHAYGMEQPRDSGPSIPISEIDVFLVPGVAFDLRGGRLGRGGGFYDGVLAQRRTDALAIGVSTDSRLRDEIPMDGHDQRVGWVATEAGIRECSPIP